MSKAENQMISLEPSSGDIDIVSEKNELNIVFQPRGKEWIMRITEKGIKFNLEAYPDSTPCDFAKEIIDLLENTFAVTIKKREPECFGKVVLLKNKVELKE